MNSGHLPPSYAQTFHPLEFTHYEGLAIMMENELQPSEVNSKSLTGERDWTLTFQVRANAHEPWRTVTVTAPVFFIALFPKP